MNKKIPLGATLALIIITMALTISVTMVVAMRYFNSNVTALAQKQSMFDNIADVDTASSTRTLTRPSCARLWPRRISPALTTRTPPISAMTPIPRRRRRRKAR